MHIRSKSGVKGVWYELSYMVMEDDLVRITMEWPPALLESHTIGGASLFVLNTPTKPRMTKELQKDTQHKGKDTETEPEPTTTSETIDLEKEAEEKDGDSTGASTLQKTKGTKRGSQASLGPHKNRKGSK